ncbi:putative vesicle-fusing ATPase [Trypanosoma theileri]|uniref:Putative vesicle-fusing ATPase n=1 Tax=Trypanosoma theileri TaxID=67003 RepID=A0A1X0P7Z6_9TRYP|nr:putative vesicle-fusing ATPase [Trypanosoma theileri]ORC92753.1 putative vesicle-fusing ATPase [Trypanosoma theileri]
MIALDSTAESLQRDPQYLLRLYHKVIQCIVKCDPSSFVRTLSPGFVQIDSKYRVRSRVKPTELWLLKGILRQIIPANIVSDRELLILLTLLPLEEYKDSKMVGESTDICVSPVTLLHCLRNLCPMRVSLLREILRTIERITPRPHPSDSVYGKTLLAKLREEKNTACVFETAPLIDYLTETFDLTISESLFLIEYCSTGSGPTCDTILLDGAYLCVLLYQHPLPVDVHFPLLMSVFTEAVGDPIGDTHSGTLALLEQLHHVQLESCSDIISRDKFDISIDIGEELANSCLTARVFEDFCKGLRVGLLTDEVRQLFQYLRLEGPREVVSVKILLREFVRHFSPAGESLFGIVEEATRRYIVKSGGILALPRLHLSLPDGFLPITTFISSLREAGVPDLVSDVELEWLRFKARDRFHLIILLCGRFPGNREALVRQLFDQIKNLENTTTKSEGVNVEHVLSQFHPENAKDALVVSGEEWRHVMSCCFSDGTSNILTFDRFLYFWAAVSAACSDDSVFTMILWRCFNMHAKR